MERRISTEAQKAETKLIQLERAKRRSLAHHEATWNAKRLVFIDDLPEDVQRMLVAGGVITDEDVALAAEMEVDRAAAD